MPLKRIDCAATDGLLFFLHCIKGVEVDTNILITIRNTAMRSRGVLSVHILMHLIWSLQNFCTPYVKPSYLQKYLHKVWCATSNPFFPPLSVLSSSFPSSPPSFSYTPTKKIWFDNFNATYALRTAKFKSNLHPAASEFNAKINNFNRIIFRLRQ